MRIRGAGLGIGVAVLLAGTPTAWAGTISSPQAGAPIYAGTGSEIELMSVVYAMGWDFTLAPGSTATFTVGQGCTGAPQNGAHCAGGAAGTATIDLAGGDDSYSDTVKLASDVRGGAGSDTISYAGRSAPVTVTLDDKPDDGESGEKDNAHSDIESIVGGSGNDRLVGTAGANLIGGGAGDDVIDGGGGADTLVGGAGTDTISARNGAVDTVDCGDGADTVVGDANDKVSGCENAQLGGTAPGVDLDKDLVATPLDCNDANPAIRPGAREIPGNRIDEDCSGADAVLAVLSATLRTSWSSGRTTRVRRLDVVAASGTAVKVRCKGRGCPQGTTTRRIGKRGRVSLTSIFRGRRLRPGAVVRLDITASGKRGRRITWTVRRGRAPKRVRALL